MNCVTYRAATMPKEESVAYWMTLVNEVGYHDLKEYVSLLQSAVEARRLGLTRRAEHLFRQAVECAEELDDYEGELLSNALVYLADHLRQLGRTREAELAQTRAAKVLSCTCQ